MKISRAKKNRNVAILTDFANQLVALTTANGLEIEEGKVMTAGPPAYRRLDCDGRALCYLRVRAARGFLRVDVSGLWSHPASDAAELAANGAAHFKIRRSADIAGVAEFLTESVRMTRSDERTRLHRPHSVA